MDAGQSRSDHALASIPQAAINSEVMEQGYGCCMGRGCGPKTGGGHRGKWMALVGWNDTWFKTGLSMVQARSL